MTFKNNLISVVVNGRSSLPRAPWKREGQAAIEYLIIFIAVALTVITFISKVHNEGGKGVLDTHFDRMAQRVLR